MSTENNTERVIIIDDEVEVVSSLVDLLKSSGIEVEGETDSEKFIKRLDEEHFDVIVTDFKMPRVSGLDIARKVNKERYESDVIIITGYGTMDLAIQSLKQNVYDFILKPFKYEELIHTIELAFERRRLINEIKQLSIEREKHLKELSTLYDINDIVVNSSSRDAVLSFAKDTLSIGIGINSAGILLNSNGSNIYTPARGVGDFEKTFPDLSIDTNDEKLMTLIKGKGIAEIDDLSMLNHSSYDRNVTDNSKVWLIPMNVSSRLAGFICVVTDSSEGPLSTEKQKLLRVLANQLGPQLRIIEEENRIPSYRQGTLVRLKKRMKKSTQIVDAYGGSVAFVFFRVILNSDSRLSGETFLKGMETLGSLIQEKINENDDLMQIGIDAFLTSLYGRSKIETELVANSMSYDFQSILSESVSKEMVINVSSTSYPEDADDVMRLYHQLVHEYSSFINQPTIKKQRHEN
ncbi:MAG: response regulator [Candidatus Marinimicrobia bacterium]|nr:response regulator [Candidatus Neomarinimicrobiota bacterium]